MKVSDLMTRTVECCGMNDTVARAAQIMWENDCGCVPVIDNDKNVVGIVTDRDICMAGYTQGRPFADIPVATAMAKQVFGVRESDPVDAAERLMSEKQIRRVPVLGDGGKIVGLLSLNNITRRTQELKGRSTDGLSSMAILQTLGAISEPRRSSKASSTAITQTNGNTSIVAV